MFLFSSEEKQASDSSFATYCNAHDKSLLLGVYEYAMKYLFSISRKGKYRYTSSDVESPGGRKTALPINMNMLH